MANRKPLVITDGVKRILGSTDYLWAPGGLTVGDNSELTFLADVGFAAIVSSEVDTPLDFSIDGGIRFSFGPNGELLVGGTVAGTAGQILSSGGSGAPVAWSSLKTINGNSLLGSGDLTISGGGGGGDQITVSATPPVSPTLNQLWLDIS